MLIFSKLLETSVSFQLLEKVVFGQLYSFLDLHGIHEEFQSGFKSLHSTENCTVEGFNDLLLLLLEYSTMYVFGVEVLDSSQRLENLWNLF